ncbi:MAG: hypothetical protein MJZ93_00790 [Paludibacteraceae bacterium]|nr:hypothetical protein [Paludibacteraceae bacterium]
MQNHSELEFSPFRIEFNSSSIRVHYGGSAKDQQRYDGPSVVHLYCHTMLCPDSVHRPARGHNHRASSV